MASYILAATAYLLRPSLKALETDSTETLSSFANSHGLSLILPSSPEYKDYAVPHNLRLSYKPAAIVLPNSDDDIKLALRAAKEAKLTVSVRSGGPTYAEHDLGGAKNVFVIDLRAFNNVSYDSEAATVTVGAGATVGAVAEALAAVGRAIPHAPTLSVGIGGHAILGGYGPSSRLFGLTADAVEAFSVVTASGNSATAKPNENAELFWALRGCGTGLAVVTSLTLRTFPAPKNAVLYEYLFNSLDSGTTAKALHAIHNYGEAGPPRELAVSTEIRPLGAIKLYGVFYGEEKAFEGVIHPIVSKLTTIMGGVKDRKVENRSWIDHLKILDEQEPTYQVPHGYYIKSLVEPSFNQARMPQWKRLSNFLLRSGQSGPPHIPPWIITIDLVGPPQLTTAESNEASSSRGHRRKPSNGGSGSAVCNPQRPSALSRRDMLHIFRFYVYTDDLQDSSEIRKNTENLELIPLADGMVESLIPGGSKGVCVGEWGRGWWGYAGYDDPAIKGVDREVFYFGGDQMRLRAVKKYYDSDGLFGSGR